MSKQANKTAIGAFIIGAVILVIVGIVIFGSGNFFAKKNPFVMYFEGSVNGLNVGASVVFRGVKIGRVTSIKIYENVDDMTFSIPVFIEINKNSYTLTGKRKIIESVDELMVQQIKRGLKGELQMQSLVTGQLMINLDFHPDKPQNLIQKNPDYIEIPTIESGLKQLAKKLEKVPIEKIFNKLLDAVEGIEKIVNSKEVGEIIYSLNGASKGLNKMIANADNQVVPLASSIENILKSARVMVNNINEKIDPLANNVTTTLDVLQKLAIDVESDIDPLVADFRNTAKTAAVVMLQAQTTLKGIENMTSDSSPVIYKLYNAFDEISAAANSLRLLTNYLERHPESLLMGKGE